MFIVALIWDLLLAIIGILIPVLIVTWAYWGVMQLIGRINGHTVSRGDDYFTLQQVFSKELFTQQKED